MSKKRVTKKTTKSANTKAKEKTTKTSKKKKKDLEVPLVLRTKSMVDVMAHTIENDENASEKVKGLPKKDLRYVLDVIQAITFGHIARGGKVQFMPYVTYESTVRLPRKGRNPQTGEEIQIPGQIAFRARAGKGLKEILNADAKYVEQRVKERQAEKEEEEARKAARSKKNTTSRKKKSA